MKNKFPWMIVGVLIALWVGTAAASAPGPALDGLKAVLLAMIDAYKEYLKGV